MSKGRKLIMAGCALAAGAVLVQGAGAQTNGAATRFDPFNPALSLNATEPVAEDPATQPALTQPPKDAIGGGVPGRPIIRDPFRPPTRSPYRP